MFVSVKSKNNNVLMVSFMRQIMCYNIRVKYLAFVTPRKVKIKYNANLGYKTMCLLTTTFDNNEKTNVT